MSLAPYITQISAVSGGTGISRLEAFGQDVSGINRIVVTPFTGFRVVALTVGFWLRIVESVVSRRIGPVPIEPTTLNEVIAAGVTLGIWPGATPTTLNEVIDSGVFIGVSSSGTLNQVITAGRHQGYWL